MNQKGISSILITLFVIVIASVGAVGYFYSQPPVKPEETPHPIVQVTASPHPKPLMESTKSASPSAIASSSADISDWKVYKESYKISYPQDWVYDPSLKSLNKVSGKEGFVIISPDFSNNSGGFPQTGAFIRLFVGQIPWSTDKKVGEQLGPESIKATKWIGASGLLEVFKYEGDYLVLTAKHKNISYQLVMSAASDDARTKYEPIFLKIAQTLIP